jgi:hypothetical protein
MEALNPKDRETPERPRPQRARPELSAMSRVDSQAGDERPTAPSRGDAPYSLSVRTVRPYDLPSLAWPPDVILLNEPRVRQQSYSAFKAAMSAIAPGRHRPYVFVAKSGSRLVGFAHFQQSGPDRRWHGIAIGAATGVYGSGPAWEELLRHATIAAGLRGVKRLFAKAPSGTPIIESFLRSNYAAYATETIFATNNPELGGEEPPVRRQEPSDAWAVHQLYTAATPKQVQYAEAFTSDRWELRRHAQGASVASWLLEEGNIVTGYIRVLSDGGDHRLDVLFHPDRPDAAKALIAAALAKLRKTPKVNRVCCAVRGYQAEAATALEARGFEPILEQDVLIKYTTAVARAALSEPATFPAELIERLPKRAPSFPYGASVGDQGQ